MLRQPIVSVLGHVDSGKTTLLDAVRGSQITGKEAGGITQMIGATEIPLEKIEGMCKPVADVFPFDLEIPGLLFIDTPGHAAFTSLRQRGSLLSDIAILVIDVTRGVMPQTREAVRMLKEYETPFIIALNKIDKLPGWRSNQVCHTMNRGTQSETAQDALQEKVYDLMATFADMDLTVQMFDDVDDFQQKVGIVPISAETGEGIPELLLLMAGLSQQFLTDRLHVDEDGVGKGTVLEVNEVEGLGTTVDIILYDGILKKSDTLVIGAVENGEPTAVTTDIKAVLKPKSLTEIRWEDKFDQVDEVTPAAGVKIAAKNLDTALAGSPIRAVHNSDDVEDAAADIREAEHSFAVDTTSHGVVIRADSLGSLEALSKTLEEEGIPVKNAQVGQVTKTDIRAAEQEEDPKYRVVFAYNTGVTETGQRLQDESAVTVIADEVIYQLLETYDTYTEQVRERIIEEKLGSVKRPARISILPGMVFRSSNPAIVGITVEEGVLLPGTTLMTPDGERIGTVKTLQNEGETVDKAVKGDEVAASITNATVGRQIDENDTLYTDIPGEDYRNLTELEEHLSQGERRVLEQVKEIKDQINPTWKIR